MTSYSHSFSQKNWTGPFGSPFARRTRASDELPSLAIVTRSTCKPMTILFEAGGADAVITDDELQNYLQAFLKKIGDRKKVMIIPPDFTRFHRSVW